MSAFSVGLPARAPAATVVSGLLAILCLDTAHAGRLFLSRLHMRLTYLRWICWTNHIVLPSNFDCPAASVRVLAKQRVYVELFGNIKI